MARSRVDHGHRGGLALTDYGAVLSARGLTLVALNDVGEIVEYRPDGGPSD